MFLSIKFLFVVLFSFRTLHGELSCGQVNVLRKFYLVRRCHRSTGEILISKRTKNVEDCEKYCRERLGFAFNYNPPENAVEYHNCQILTCPEFANLTNLVNDTNFDYYSSYANLNGGSLCRVEINISFRFS